MPATTNTGPTLTRIAYFGRVGVKWGSILIVLLIVGRTFLTAAYNFYVYLNPPPPPPPTVGFGALPPIAFPSQSATDKPASYRLETANGSLPVFPDRAKVILAQRSTLNLLADQRAKQYATAYGFTDQPNVLNPRLYRWTKIQPLQATLEMDLQNFHFKITSDYLARPELLSKKVFPQSPAETVKSFLNSTVSYDRDIATQSGKLTYLRSVGTDVVSAFSLSDADFLAVDLNRAPIDGKYPFYTAKGDRGVIHAVLTGALGNKDQIVELEYGYQKFDYSQVQTYPLRDVSLAWQALQAGEGYIANKTSTGSAVIRDVSLGYFDDTNEQDYAQPVYVFRGDGDFIGLVPAIDAGYILKDGSSSQTTISPQNSATGVR